MHASGLTCLATQWFKQMPQRKLRLTMAKYPMTTKVIPSQRAERMVSQSASLSSMNENAPKQYHPDAEGYDVSKDLFGLHAATR